MGPPRASASAREHDLNVIRCVHWTIDLVLKGGDKGGEIVVCGTLEKYSYSSIFHTSRYLKQVLVQHHASFRRCVGTRSLDWAITP
jgi:hypothetical protein